MNKVMLIGHVGKEPETKGKNNNVIKFSLATNEKANGEKVTVWHNIIAFGKTMDNIKKYVHKGDKLFVEGKLQYNEFEKDGIKRTFTEIICYNIEFLGGEKKQEPKYSNKKDDNGFNESYNKNNDVEEDDEDDVPF